MNQAPPLPLAGVLASGMQPGADRLQCTLALTIGGRAYKIPGGQIKSLSLDLSSHGFTGEVAFMLANDSALGGPHTDDLYDSFIGDALIELTLGVQTPRKDEESNSGTPQLKLRALVSDRWVTEHAIAKHPGTSRLRRYQVRFTDPAQLLWKQHFPCELYTGKTWRDVIEANRGQHVTLTYDWDLLTAVRPQVFLGHEPSAAAASFYDFVLWLADIHGGFFTYDYARQTYRLSEGQPTDLTFTKLHPRDTAGLRLELPVLPRHSVRIHNSSTEINKTTVVSPVTKKRSEPGIHQDYLMRTPLTSEVDNRVALERRRMDAASGPLLRVEFHRLPTSPIAPGFACILTNQDDFLASDVVLPGPFSGAKARVRHFQLAAQAQRQELDADYSADAAAFQLQAVVLLEHRSQERPPALSYVPPSYPRLVEGKVMSEEGGEKDETYQIYEDPSTSTESYKVQIPLFGNQEVLVDFQPHWTSGHFYFPAYKQARVLVALDFERAWLVRYLDWRTEARLPKETQGNHLLVGKTPENGASLRHLYEDDKPVFRLKRTHDKDTQLIEIAEGRLLIQVKEEN